MSPHSVWIYFIRERGFLVIECFREMIYLMVLAQVKRSGSGLSYCRDGVSQWLEVISDVL